MIEAKKLVKEYKSRLYLAETGIKPLDWLIDKIYDIYRLILANREACKRSKFWAEKMKYSYDFDGHTIYEMLYYKLDRMEKCMTEHGHCVWNSCPEEPEYKLMLDLRRARDLAKKLSTMEEHDYLPDLVKAHDEKWGKRKSNLDKKNRLPEDYDEKGNMLYRSWRKNAKTEEEKEQERKEIRILYKKQNQARLDDMIEFFELLKYNVDLWWD